LDHPRLPMIMNLHWLDLVCYRVQSWPTTRPSRHLVKSHQCIRYTPNFKGQQNRCWLHYRCIMGWRNAWGGGDLSLQFWLQRRVSMNRPHSQ